MSHASVYPRIIDLPQSEPVLRAFSDFPQNVIPATRFIGTAKRLPCLWPDRMLAAMAFFYEGMVAPRNTGAYVPAHTEKGF